MASDYGLNFGFRRSDEHVSVREGRNKTPASGSALLLGAAVQLDPSSLGYLKKCAANAPAVTGLCGVLVQEESHIYGLFDLQSHDSIDLGSAKLDQLSTMWSGAGVKVWLKNTAAYSRPPRSKGAVTIVDVTSVAVGDHLGWDGSKWVKSDGSTTPHWMTVTAVSGSAATSTAYCEAVLTF